ncbi:hypothetical protein NRB16_04140 [Pseudomonas sp. LJDD11]|uniref:GTA-gp10 family protein n=1 Tax=Pseudomonas sp. LJDD11 TaxID=2931984 RepID=UPI00211BD019|nr:GTA-gp10 family protein [Pseudomonas sp. LJDD11]MCQ9422722.1 hypothetical protein [Pseudomonas sp. LJDD11]
MSRTNHGTVVIQIGDEEHVLKPSLKALKAIEGRFGGILPALNSVGRANLTDVAFIIGVGSGIGPGNKKALDALEEAVFDAGLNKVGSQVPPYLTAFLNPAGKTDAELEADAAAAAAEGNE